MMNWPVTLQVRGWRCVIVGGGKVARRRALPLHEAGAQLVIISPAIDPAIEALQGVTLHKRPWRQGDMAGAKLAIIATSDPAVNHAAALEAARAGALVNRTDDSAAGDLAIPAVARRGPVTLAVDTQGASAAAAAAIVRELADALHPHWPAMLELALAWRSRIQQACEDAPQRLARLAAMTDARAIAIHHAQGRPGLEAFYRQLADPQWRDDPRQAGATS